MLYLVITKKGVDNYGKNIEKIKRKRTNKNGN